jgi:hypothetical protein
MKRIPLCLCLLTTVFAQISIAAEVDAEYRGIAAEIIASHSPEKVVRADDTNYWKKLGAAYTISRDEANRGHRKTMKIMSSFGDIDVSLEQLTDGSYKTSFCFPDSVSPFFSITWHSLENVLESLTIRAISY